VPVPGDAPADTTPTPPPGPPTESAPAEARNAALPRSSAPPPPARVVQGGDAGNTGRRARQDRNSDSRSEDTGKTANHTTSGDTDTAVVASHTPSDFQAHTDRGDTVTNGARGSAGRVSSTGQGEPNTTETLGLIAVVTAILIAVLLAWSKLFPGNTA
jgi:hypothetical protein